MHEFILNKNSYIGYFRNMIDDMDSIIDELKDGVDEKYIYVMKELRSRIEDNNFYHELHDYLTVGICLKAEVFADLVHPFTIPNTLNNTNKELLETEFNALNKIYTIVGVNVTQLIACLDNKMILDEDAFKEIYEDIKMNIEETLDTYELDNEERDKKLNRNYRKNISIYNKISEWEDNHAYIR